MPSRVTYVLERFFNAKAVHFFLIAIVGLITYSNTFHVPFVFDDIANIVRNPVIKNLDNFIAHTNGYDYNPRRFICYLTFALNYYYGGLDEMGYHIVNLIIHIGNAFLVYFLVTLTFRTPYFREQRTDDKTQSIEYREYGMISLFSALLFVVHPIQTQAVTYIVQRFTSLATLFYLFSVVMYIKGRLGAVGEGQGAKDEGNASVPIAHRLSPVAYYLLSLFSAVLAMKTKEIAFTLPFIIILYEFSFFGSSLRKRLLLLVPVLLTQVIIPLSMMGTGQPLGKLLSDISEKTRVHTGVPRWDYLMTQMRVITTYIRLLFFPVDQNLDYDYPVSHSLFEPSVFFSFLFLLTVFGGAVWMMCKSQRAWGIAHSVKASETETESAISSQPAEDTPLNPPLLREELKWGGFHYSRSTIHDPRLYRLIAFGVFWFFITLSVESSVIPIADVIFEHRAYLPSAGAFIGLMTMVFMMVSGRTSQMKAVISILLLVLIFSAASYARNSVWQNALTLWQDVVKKSPNKETGYGNLGLAYVEKGQYEKAIDLYKKVIILKPSSVAFNNLGDAFEKIGKLDRAIANFDKAIDWDPNYGDAYYNRGVAYGKAGLFDKAIDSVNKSLEIDPYRVDAYIERGVSYTAIGRHNKALEDFNKAISFDPSYPLAYYDRAYLYLISGNRILAVSDYEKACDLKDERACIALQRLRRGIMEHRE